MLTSPYRFRFLNFLSNFFFVWQAYLKWPVRVKLLCHHIFLPAFLVFPGYRLRIQNGYPQYWLFVADKDWLFEYENNGLLLTAIIYLDQYHQVKHTFFISRIFRWNIGHHFLVKEYILLMPFSFKGVTTSMPASILPSLRREMIMSVVSSFTTNLIRGISL